MQTLLFANRDTSKVHFNDKPVDLHKHIYMFSYTGSNNKKHVFKLVQYTKDGFTWLNIFDNGHWFVNPNGRTETLEQALALVAHYDIKIFECKNHKEICEFISDNQ